MELATCRILYLMSDNKLQLNADKCKEMVIDISNVSSAAFQLTPKNFSYWSVKILDITISNSLQWFNHVNEVVKKAYKRLYFFHLGERANAPVHDILSFSCTPSWSSWILK